MIALLALIACTDKGDSNGGGLEADTDTDTDRRSVAAATAVNE